jgi:hypothetical protein
MTMTFRCGHSSSLARCATTGCRKPATVLCRFPVTRRGRTTACNRMVCTSCASKPDRYCPPHARGLVTGAAPELVEICSACYTASCVHGEHRCPTPGRRRKVTVREWKRLLSFGVP